MKFRKGDVVSICGTVEYDHGTGDDTDMLFIKIKGHYTSLGLTPDHFDETKLTLVLPRFDVGDSVCFKIGADENYVYGVILAISDGHAWIDYQSGDFCTRTLTSIERVPIEDDIP